MKRLVTSLVVLLCSLLTTFGQALSGTGDGTEESPYKIFNENQLSQLANYLNQEGVVFRLMNDLDITDWIAENNPHQGWIPIGVESSPFKGKFYGDNHTIKGVMINRTSTDNVGFFGYVSGATITNLTIEGTTIAGNQNVGGMVGYITGSTVTNCHVKMDGVNGVTGTTLVGGFAGYSNNTNFQTFSVEAKVSGSQSRVGGFVGKAENGGAFSDGSFSGEVVGAANHTGGLIGYGIGLTLTNIIVKGTVSGKSYTGGILACNENGILNNCRYEGTLTGSQYVGGIVGALVSTASSFTSCFSKGKITTTGNYCGGVVGVSQGGLIEKMEDCSHFGDINGQSYVGGLVGSVNNTVVAPVLHSYVGSDNPNGSSGKSYDEVIANGSGVVKRINNCTAIGNFFGISNIGGLIGSETSADGYITSSNKIGEWYVFENGIMIHYGGNFTYYTYTRNTISICLTNSYYSGTLQGTDNVGGLYGYKSGGTIQNNYSYANIYGTTNVGGIAGYIADEKVSNTYNTTTVKSNVSNNTVISATSANIGRVYGKADVDHAVIGALASTEGNRALTQTRVILCGVVQEVDDDFQNGTSIGPSLLKLKANYVSWGWDFENNWNMLETECYPYKKYQAAPPVIESNLVSQATSISGKSIDGGTVYLYYKDREAVSTQCDGNQWTFNTDALQSGALVQIYADVDGMTPSYFTTTTVGYPGSGTEDDPWRIYTAEDLQGACNRGYYKVMNDIDLTQWINENSPVKGWPAIGRNSGEATFIDGDGHKVTGLWTNTTDNYTGLFSNFSAGQIKNLNVEVATGKSVKGGDFTGILIGRNANGRIVNCSVTGDVEGTVHVGGVVGYVETTTLNATTFDGKVSSTADNAYVGGLAGQMVGCTVTTCRSAATINASGVNNCVGGLAGYAKEGTISKSIANNTLNATGTGNYVGGFVGYSETPITLSVSTGSASATGDNSYAGGLVGYTKSPISNSYSTTNTTGTQYTAGLVGYTFNSIDKCYAKGNVYGVQKGGGVVGELDGHNASLTNSVACNNILSLTAQNAWGSRVIGNFKNGAADPDQSNYALSTMQVSLNNVPQIKKDDLVEGIAKTEAELMQVATYQTIGWNFSEVWGVDEGQMFPYLLWEVDVNPVADVTFDKTTLLIAVGKTETITPSVLPLGATNKRLNWTSSKPGVATVEEGVVTAVGVGTAIITATTTDGTNISATCNVTVTANHDAAIAELQAIVDRAQSLYDNSTEGDNIGQYAVGSRAVLLQVINSVKAKISSTMSDETITECTNEINAAIDTFQSKKVTAGEDTDISKIANTIYVDRVEAAAGSQLKLSVKMKNTVSVQGFQFDLYLPDGVTVATDEDGMLMAELSTARTSAKKTDYFNCTSQPDGSLRVLCGSSKGYTFSDNDGEVAVITLNIANDMEEGEHPIIMKEVSISDNESNSYDTDYVKSTLVISSYTLGDVNADGKINVADFIGVANYILGNASASFVEKAADVNEDGKINVADFIGIANIILEGNNIVNSQNLMLAAPRRAATNIDVLDNVIYVEPVTAQAGNQQVLSIKMKNTNDVAGFEFNLQLPEGVTVATDGDDMLMAELSTERTTAKKTDYFNSTLQSDGTLKVLCGTSTQNPNTGKLYAFNGNEGEVARVTVNVASNVANGEYPIIVKNAVISDTEAQSTDLPASVETTLTVGQNVIVLDENSTTAPVAATNVNVKVKRTINAGEWSTIVLPFAMTETQVKAAFGDDVELADFTGYDTTKDADENIVGITINFNDNITAIEANHPYIIKVSNAITEFTVDGVDINPVDKPKKEYKTEGKKPKVLGTFAGTYVAEFDFYTDATNYPLFLSGNKIYYATENTQHMKAFRAYFDFTDYLAEAEAAAARISMVFDESGTTGISTIGDKTNDGKYYNLQGMPVEKPSHGLYIHNGRKIFIK